MTTVGYSNNTINLNDWSLVSDFIDSNIIIPPWMFEQVIQSNKYPVHAYSKGQLASKAWLVSVLQSLDITTAPTTVAILGGWIGSLVPFLHSSFAINRIYGLDIDSASIALSEELNQRYVQDAWKYKGVVADVSALHTCDMEFETGGELISVCPDWVINTSCEHMNESWFHTASSDQLIIMQTNNSPDYEGHINICDNEYAMQLKYPLNKILYSGTMITPAYTRLMQIGYK